MALQGFTEQANSFVSARGADPAAFYPWARQTIPRSPTSNKERIANSLRRDIEVDVVIVTGQAPVLGAVNDRALRLGLGELGTHGLGARSGARQVGVKEHST
jgi:hypothetical protein